METPATETAETTERQRRRRPETVGGDGDSDGDSRDNTGHNCIVYITDM